MLLPIQAFSQDILLPAFTLGCHFQYKALYVLNLLYCCQISYCTVLKDIFICFQVTIHSKLVTLREEESWKTRKGNQI